MFFKYLGKLFRKFINLFKRPAKKNQPKKIDRGRDSIKVSAKAVTKKGITFPDALLDALEYVRPQMCVQPSCFDHQAFKERKEIRYPVYISRISFVCAKCGHYYPIVNNKATRLIKYMKSIPAVQR